VVAGVVGEAVVAEVAVGAVEAGHRAAGMVVVVANSI
jgi:hypothetical protein